MTRDEVISGLEKCAASECNEKCPYNGINYGCRPRLMLDAVELLKELEQKINSLEEQLRLLEYGDQETQEECEAMDMMHTECLRCGKPAVSIPFNFDELGMKVSYTHYSYCEKCLREGLNMLKEKVPEENKKSHVFKRATMKLKDILPLIRSSGYDNRDESGTDIIICPECEEWTHVKFNLNSGLLDLLGELTVESIDASDDDIVLWIKTDDFNYFDGSMMYMEHYKRGREDEAGLRDGTIMKTFSPD